MDSDGVILLSKAQIGELREKLESLLPHSLTVLGVCKSILAGVVDREVMVDKWPDFSVLVDRPTPGHGHPSSGVKRLQNTQCIFTTGSDEGLLENFLLKQGVLKWHLPAVVVPACQPSIKGPIIRAAEKKGRALSVLGQISTYLLSSKDPMPQPKIPPGYTLGSVSLDEVSTIASNWAAFGGDDDKDQYVRLVLKSFPSVAIRETETGALVGYYLQHWTQSLGLLYVREGHRGKGLGKILVAEKARQCFQNGDPVVFIRVLSTNKASCIIHEKCGFTKAEGGDVEWLVIEDADQ